MVLEAPWHLRVVFKGTICDPSGKLQYDNTGAYCRSSTMVCNECFPVL